MEEKFRAEDAQLGATMFIFGPVLLSFVSWVLKEASMTGKRRLYFLSRDGWLMYRMAKRLCRTGEVYASDGSSVECRYLYASRYAWRIPEQHLIGEKSLERICRGGMHVTFIDMMQRAGLTEEEGKNIAKLVCPERDMEEALPWSEIQRLRIPLSRCREFRELADNRSRSRYHAVIAYLSQEGLFEEVPYALVDSGWIGTMQESLQHLLESSGYRGRIDGYYFGLYRVPEGASRQHFHAFYFGPEEGIWRKTLFSNCLFECVFTAPHGMTEGYKNINGLWSPCLFQMKEEAGEWIRQQIRLLELYMDIAVEAYGSELKEEMKRLPLENLLCSLMASPSVEEAAFYGSIPFSDEVTEKKMLPLAAKLTQCQLFGYHPLPRLCLQLLPGRMKMKDSGWIEGSIRLYGGWLYGWHRVGVFQYKYALYVRMQHDYRKRRKAA